jgi:holo-[acyl-carrier protein] synthase
MIFGVGTDICDVRRIRATYARRGERFAAKVLGAHEIEVFRARLARVEARGISYLATRFSAKEAFSKPSGKPEIRLHGRLADWFAARRLRAHVSVTDETDYAASFVVVESTEEPR